MTAEMVWRAHVEISNVRQQVGRRCPSVDQLRRLDKANEVMIAAGKKRFLLSPK